jgi:tetratricopeptide (TPR) repeat protein
MADQQPTWLDSLAASDDDFLVHLQDWHRAFVYRGRSAQYGDYLKAIARTLRQRKGLHSIKGVAVLGALGGVLRRQGSKHFRAADKALHAARAVAQDFAFVPAVIRLLGRIEYDLGYIPFLQNDYDTSLAFLTAGAKTDAKARNKTGKRITESVRVLVQARMTGHFNSVELADNLAAFKDIEDPDASRWVINCQVHLGEYMLYGGEDPEKALGYLEDASRGNDNLGLVTGRPKLLRLQGVALLRLGDVDKALAALSASAALYRALHETEGFSDVCYEYGVTLEASGQLDGARMIYELGLSSDPGMDNTRGIALCRVRSQCLRGE